MIDGVNVEVDRGTVTMVVETASKDGKSTVRTIDVLFPGPFRITLNDDRRLFKVGDSVIIKLERA